MAGWNYECIHDMDGWMDGWIVGLNDVNLGDDYQTDCKIDLTFTPNKKETNFIFYRKVTQCTSLL